MNRIFFVLFLVFAACAPKTKTLNNEPNPEAINQPAANNVADWVKKGSEGYGIIISELSSGKVIAKAVRIKVVSIRADQIKVKALESVSLLGGDCNKLGISYGETWWEKDGDIYKTEREALQKITRKGWILR